jgi:hypothetical protein
LRFYQEKSTRPKQKLHLFPIDDVIIVFQTIGVTSASPIMDPQPRRGGRAASAARACFEVIHDEVNSVTIGSATAETVSLRCKLCRGGGGTKGSLRKSGHFVAFLAEEHVLRHCQPEISQGHELETARNEVSVQKVSARCGKDNRPVGRFMATIAGVYV